MGGRLTVGRLMAAIAALAVLLAAGMYRWQNADVDKATISANLWTLRRGDAAARRQAAQDLTRIRPVDSASVEVALAEAAVGDADGAVRASAVNTLGWVIRASQRGQPPGKASAPAADLTPTRALLRALDDPEIEVRRNAVWAISSVLDAGLVTPALTSAIMARLFRFLDDPDPDLRARAIACLGWTKRPPIEARGRALTLIDTDPDSKVRLAAIQALLFGWPSADLYPIMLARRATAPTAQERKLILRGLCEITPPPEAIPELLALMATDPEAARWVPQALTKLGKGARPYLGAIARVAEPQMEQLAPPLWSAVYALLRIDPASPEAQTLLERVAEHLRDAPDDANLEHLTWFLDQYGRSAAPVVPILSAALHSPVAKVRAAAARLLGGLGAAASPASAELDGLSRQDPDLAVRATAAQALNRLRETIANEPPAPN